MEAELIDTPEADAKALTDRELMEVNYVMLRRIVAFTDQLAEVAAGMKDNPMLAMMLGGKRK
jgi:hypothetical protein